MRFSSRWLIAGLALVGILASLALWQFTLLKTLLTLNQIVRFDEGIRDWLEGNLPLGCLLFVLAYLVAASLGLPGVSLLSFSGGFLFGPVLNPLLVNLGATGGALVLFGFVRTTLGAGLRSRFESRLTTFYRETSENGFGYLLSLRFLPVVPFFVVNLIGGLGGFRVVTFVWTTALGILPGSIVNSFIGWSAGELLEKPGELPWSVYLALGALAALSFSSALLRWFSRRNREPKS